MKWILAPDLFRENLKELKAQIVAQGMSYIDIPKLSLHSRNEFDDLMKVEVAKGPYLFYGPIETAQHILHNHQYYPGAYCYLRNFECSYYYPRLYDFILNRHHVFIPAGLLLERKEWLYREFGIDDTIFIRPNTGTKKFTGMTVCKDRFEKDLDIHGLGCSFIIPKEEMVIVAEPKDIDEEYRIVFAKPKAVTGSMYKDCGKSKQIGEECIPKEVWEYADKVVEQFYPEWCFTMDIGITAYGPKLIEINSFSCSGLYKCNIEKVVREVSRTATEDWMDVYG